MNKLELTDVTLACVDTRAPATAVAAMQRCMAQVKFARAVLFTDAAAIAALPSDIDGVAIRIGSVDDYSQFLLRGLEQHITTAHVLIVQWDGYVLDAAQWDPVFLGYDYIGANFHSGPADRTVGNGGFSLRSRRLLDAMQDPAMVLSNPEDTCICHLNRERLERDHGIRFAPAQLASRFSFERLPPKGPTFGFHGLFNMHRIMSTCELGTLLQSLPDELVCGVDGRDLCCTLIDCGQFTLAELIISKRRRLGLLHNRTLRLRWALARAKFFHSSA